jgi:histidinol-phosphate aminotransferase
MCSLDIDKYLAIDCLSSKPLELQRELGLDEVVKLASNENPLPVSHRVRMAIEQAITEVGRYPDGNGFVVAR